jgi:hypothetical protein
MRKRSDARGDRKMIKPNGIFAMNMNQNPTITELTNLFSNCNDAEAHHVMWVDENGEVLIDRLPKNRTMKDFEEARLSLKIRYETWISGKGYVGKKSSNDDSFMARMFKSLEVEWKQNHDAKESVYIDVF